MTTHPNPVPTRPRPGLGGVSKPYLVGLGLAAVGFVFRLSFSSESTSNGVQTSCTFLDVGALAIAAAVAVVALAALVHNAARPVEQRLPVLEAVGLSAALLAISGLHVLRGLGVVGGPC